MKIPASLSNLLQFLLRPVFWLGRLISKICFAIFGRVSWSPPSWLSRGDAAWSQFGNTRPKTNAALVIAVLLIICGSLWTWNWYQSRPKPHRVSASVVAIPITKLDKELLYPPLVIQFSDPAA